MGDDVWLGYGGGGGGGWYGGGASQLYDEDPIGSGACGSGYIGGVSNGQTIGGNQSMLSPNGGPEIGQLGNGYARITLTKPDDMAVVPVHVPLV